MRARELLAEKLIIPRDTFLNADDWMKTVVAINPTKTEFWSPNFRQAKDGSVTQMPDAAGVLMQDRKTVVIGCGHCLAHDTICGYAGLDINNELFRLQIHNGAVHAELWLDEDAVTHDDPLEKKIAQAEAQYGMSVDEMKKVLFDATQRFTGGWEAKLMLWCDYAEQVTI